MYATFIALVAVVLAVYWWRRRLWRPGTSSRTTFAILPLMLVLLFLSGRDRIEFDDAAQPVLLAIAADVSLSMGTIPDPDASDDTRTRLERAQQTLLPLLARLGAAPRPALVSVSAFTSKSETILAWDDDLSLAREIIEYVLTTGLLTEAGSDLDVALNGVVPMYESLPETYRDPEWPKYLIVVSDGEQTLTQGGGDIAIGKLRDLGVRIIALHVGREDLPEGLPVYDEAEGFIGFEEVDGKIFSVPNPELMAELAGNESATGLFVRAENAAAAAVIADYIGLQSVGNGSGGFRSATVILLWVLLMAGLLRYGFEV